MNSVQQVTGRQQLMLSLRDVFLDPADPARLSELVLRLRIPKWSRAMNLVAAWLSAALSSQGLPSRASTQSEVTALLTILLMDETGSAHDATIERLSKHLPHDADTWMARSVLAARSGRPDLAERCARRAALLSATRHGAYRTLAHNAAQDRSPEDRARLLRYCTLLAPEDVAYHHELAGILLNALPIDHRPGTLLRNATRRVVLLDPAGEFRRFDPVTMFRRLGDAEAFERALDRETVLRANPGAPTPAKRSQIFARFRALLSDPEPPAVQRDFPARVVNSRVLIHPRLPDDGTWIVEGPADQVERALKILAFVNPSATLLSDADAAPAMARRLSTVPSNDPDVWLMPCLFGHYHVYWTVLPAILEAGGRPSLERMVEFCLRTRQFVQFWYPKGHERQFLLRNRAIGRANAERMADEASRTNYLTTLDGNQRDYVRQFFENAPHRAQYFDYAVYRPGDVVMNLGVAEGFEIPAYLSMISPGGTLHNIDPSGYDYLGEPARQWIDGSDSQVRLHRLALTDRDGEIEMDIGGCWEDMRVSKRQLGRTRTIPAQRLDTFVRENGLTRIDHIKLDIEGGEGFLLDQLIALMRSHRPQIEISIYHTVEQFIEIPDRMMRESEGYAFYFYHYCGHFGEGTLYAIPQEIAAVPPLRPS